MVVLGVLLVAMALVTLIGFGLSRKTQTAVDDSRRNLEAQWKRFEPRVAVDQARWRDDPLISPHAGGDAAELVFAHVRWESEQKAGKPAPIPETLTVKFTQDWWTRVDELDVAEVDLGWMSRLAEFGFWELEGLTSPLAKQPFVVFTEDIPNFVDAQWAAKVRLAQGLKSGDAREAAREVREFARLALTTEHLVGLMIGTAMLGIERHVYEEAVRRGQNVEGWTPVSEVDQQALKGAIWAAAAPHSLLAQAPLRDVDLPVGRCAGLREGIGGAWYLRGWVEDDMPDRYTSLTKALDASTCRLPRARAAWHGTSKAGQLPVDGSAFCTAGSDKPVENCNVPDLVVHLPFVKSSIGAIISSIAAPEWFRPYEAP